MKPFVHKDPPPPVKSLSSNTLSDQYRDSITIAYRFLGNTIPEISFEFCGHCFETPIMMGPIGGFSTEREQESAAALEAAKAVAEAGSVFWSDFHDRACWEQILKAGIPALRVIKPLADNDKLLEEIAFDTANGAIGYAMDVDHGMNTYGEQDGPPFMKFNSKSLNDLRLLNDASPLPYFLKGILTVHDAEIAAEAGCAGFVVSGHNNRLPCMVPPLKVLPELRRAVGDSMKIFADGGMLTGYEAFKAIALGADGVLCARGLLGAYRKGGAEELAYKLQEMTAELAGAMANTGSPDLQHINRESIILP